MKNNKIQKTSTIPNTSNPSSYGPLSVSMLLPGDVLLHSSQNPGLIQKRISKVTSSPYTHASIYIGDGYIAEAVRPRIKKTYLTINSENAELIGVLRTQMGFGGERPKKLIEFIDELIHNKCKYDFKGVFKFNKKNKQFFENQIDEIRNNFGQTTSIESFRTDNYFCSALIVACFSVVGIIGDSAQVAYPPKIFGPADLHRDATFGWFLGYITSQDINIPKGDPLRTLTSWNNMNEIHWW